MSKADDYNAAELAAGRITPAHVTTLTRAWQATHKLYVDGMCGPDTRASLDAAGETVPEPTPSEQLSAAGVRAIASSHAYWLKDIVDPKASDTSPDAKRCCAEIDTMIRAATCLNWYWEPAYAGDGQFEWCGAFAASCWPGIKRSIRQTFFASTYRLDRYARYMPVGNDPNPKPASGPYRLIVDLGETSTPASLTFTPRPGDLLLIGPKAGYGQHICVVESFDAATCMFSTYEGNGTGKGPNGEIQQGVVRGQRRLGGVAGQWMARRLIRPAPSDLGA
jgi:hypothetical protein